VQADAAGRVLANVAHRTGTLASLRQLAGVAGEISVATDISAVVLHNGTGGQGRVMLGDARGVLLLEITLVTTGRPVPANGTNYTLVGATVVLDSLGAFNAATGVLNLTSAQAALYRALTFVTKGAFEERDANGTFRAILVASSAVHNQSPSQSAVFGIDSSRTLSIGNSPFDNFNHGAITGPIQAGQDQTTDCDLTLRLQMWGLPV